MAFLSACATTQQTESVAVTSYQATGSVLSQVHASAVALKAAGKLSAAQEAQFNTIYAQAVTAYKALGDALILAIETTDAAKQGQIQANIGTLTMQLAALVTQVATFIQGVK
jgi:hypothetical protein